MTFTEFDAVIDYLIESLGLNENKAIEVAMGIFAIVGTGGYSAEEIEEDFAKNLLKLF